jgi:hypothetical protein
MKMKTTKYQQIVKQPVRRGGGHLYSGHRPFELNLSPETKAVRSAFNDVEVSRVIAEAKYYSREALSLNQVHVFTWMRECLDKQTFFYQHRSPWAAFWGATNLLIRSAVTGENRMKIDKPIRRMVELALNPIEIFKLRVKSARCWLRRDVHELFSQWANGRRKFPSPALVFEGVDSLISSEYAKYLTKPERKHVVIELLKESGENGFCLIQSKIEIVKPEILEVGIPEFGFGNPTPKWMGYRRIIR